ncbi:MAG: hypothetical protein QXP60_07080 [Nitrososphaerota archaeon]
MIDVNRIIEKQKYLIPIFLIISIIATSILLFIAVFILAIGIVLTILLSLFLLIFVKRSSRLFLIKFPFKIVKYGFNISKKWTILLGEEKELIEKAIEHQKIIKGKVFKGKIEIGYSPLIGLFLSYFKKCGISKKSIEEGLLIAGDRAENIAGLIIKNIDKCIIIGRGKMPKIENKKIKYIQFGKEHTFNPFEYNGNVKKWADSLSIAISNSAILDIDDANMLANYFIYSKSINPTSFKTLDWIEEIDDYVGIYRSHPIKASLRNLLLGLDAVSGRGDITIESLLKEINEYDILYLDLGNLDEKAYNFISSFLLLVLENINTTFIIYDFNLISPSEKLYGAKTRMILRRIIDEAKKRKNTIFISRSPMVSPMVYSAIKNIIVSSGLDIDSIRILNNILGIKEGILNEIHEQEAICKINNEKMVFIYNPIEEYEFIPEIKKEEIKEEVKKEYRTIPIEIMKTTLYREFKEECYNAYNILLYVSFMKRVLKEELKNQFKGLEEIINKLINLAYILEQQYLSLTPKGEFSIKEFEKFSKEIKEEIVEEEPSLQPTIEAYKEEKPILNENLIRAINRAEEYLTLGNIKKSITLSYLFIYRALKILAGINKGSIEEISKLLRLEGYTIDSSELAKVKGIFVRSRKGEAISEDEAKFCLKIAKHIKSFFREEDRIESISGTKENIERSI